MELLGNLWLGLSVALEPAVLLYCLLGVFLGTFIGVLPGIGPLAAISLLLPVTYYIDPTSSIVMLAGVYYGSEYGGSTASILLNVPGTTANAVTCVDGYPMARQGRAGVALFMVAVGSLAGGIMGVIALILFSPLIVAIGLRFGAQEYFSLMVFGLVASAGVATGSPLKGLAMVVFGLLLSTIGMDINTGIPRFNFGLVSLMDGISLVVLAMGLFGVTEVVKNIATTNPTLLQEKITVRSMLPTREDVRQSTAPIARGSFVGLVLGALPGTGPAIASFLAYAIEKRRAKDPSRFGKGAIEGVVAPEAANNAAAQTAFIPTLMLGIPGSATMAVMLGALIIHGINPGPQMVVEEPRLFWGLVASFFIGNILLVILNIPLIGIWVSMLKIPPKALFSTIIVLVMIGVYGVHYNTFDILLVAIVGVVGYAMHVLRFEAAPVLLGFVLGPLLEQNFRRSMLLSRGDLATFVEHPISLFILLLTLGVVAFTIYSSYLRGSARRAQSALEAKGDVVSSGADR
jgi:TctA family transporter